MHFDPHYACLTKKTYTLDDYSIVSIREQDIMLIRDWRNQQTDILRQKQPISKNEQTKYFESFIWPTFTQQEPKQILVSFLYQDRLIGYGGLVHIMWEDRRCELSFLLNPERHILSQYARDLTAFITLVKLMAFKDLGFHRIYAETYNIRDWHVSVLEKNGFIREGVMKDHIYINGQFVDSLIHGCLNY